MKKLFLLSMVITLISSFSYGQYCGLPMWRMNFFAGGATYKSVSSYKAGASVSYFPENDHLGFDLGGYVYSTTKTYLLDKKPFTQEDPKFDVTGRVIWRINQFGDFKHELTVFTSFHQILGASYRFQYLWGERTGATLIGIEPFVSIKEVGVNLIVNFELN